MNLKDFLLFCLTAVVILFIVNNVFSKHEPTRVEYVEKYIIIPEYKIEGVVTPCPLDQNWLIKEKGEF